MENKNIEQIRELIKEKAGEFSEQIDNPPDMEATQCYDYIYSRLTIYVLDWCMDFLKTANEEILSSKHVQNIKAFLDTHATSFTDVEINLRWGNGDCRK